MANTTNFNWETPDDTDLVKDGAAAIRTLGNSIDTSFVDLKGGTTGQVLAKASNTDLDFTWTAGGDITEVQAGVGISVASGTGPIPVITNSSTDLITTAGDLLYGTAADTVARLGIGTAGQVLKVNSGATAPEWGAASQITNYTLLNAGGTALTGATTITISSLSGYNKYHIRIEGASTVNSSAAIAFRFNSDTNNLMQATGIQFDGSTLSVVYGDDNKIIIGETGTTAGDDLYCNMQVDGANSAGLKSFVFSTSGSGSSPITTPGMVGHYRGTSVISSLNLISLSGNFDAGTVYVYGA